MYSQIQFPAYATGQKILDKLSTTSRQQMGCSPVSKACCPAEAAVVEANILRFFSLQAPAPDESLLSIGWMPSLQVIYRVELEAAQRKRNVLTPGPTFCHGMH
jgi:hypothetical protein